MSKQTAASIRYDNLCDLCIQSLPPLSFSPWKSKNLTQILAFFDYVKFSADFLNLDEIYEDVLDFPKLKQHMEKTLVDYNEYPGQVQMDLVLFRDAIEHGL